MTLIEGYKDEAYRCIEIGIQALTEGELEKAEKFLLKAEKFYPTQRAKDALAQVKSTPNGARAGNRREAESHSEGPRKRKNSDGRNAEPEYTIEQLEAVRKLEKCRNYYEVLGITKECTDSEIIKKAYKELALQLHPDKNKAPGAEEAFKALGNAAAILTDPKKREAYDLHGINDPFNLHGGSQNSDAADTGMARTYYTNDYSPADVSAEEIFKLFFPDGFPEANVYKQYQHHDNRENQNSSSAPINLLPILLLIGLYMILSWWTS